MRTLACVLALLSLGKHDTAQAAESGSWSFLDTPQPPPFVAVAEAQPDDTVVDGLPVTKDEAIVGLLIIIIVGACVCCCVIGVIIVVMSKKNTG